MIKSGIAVSLLLALIFCFVPVSGQVAPLPPSNLRVNYCIEPLGIDDPQPRFSWEVNDSDRDEKQSAYEIIVASSEAIINADNGDIWSSGRIYSSKQNGVFYQGTDLCGRTKYWWKVCTWDKDGLRGTWSAPASFETAMIKESDWKASFLSGRFNLLRNEFPTQNGKVISKARAYVTSTGWFEFFVNGHKAGDHVLDPLPTQTGGANYLYLYVTFDITSMLNPGADNAIGMMLGTGLNYRDEYKKALCQIDIWYTDGTTQTLTSNGSWKSLWGGPVMHQHVFDGERYDARKELPGWNMPGFDDSAWLSPVVSSPGIPAGWQVTNGILDAKGGEEGFIREGQSWNDFTLEGDIKIINICTGIIFRATDEKNLYMWQINAGNPGRLRPHKMINGSYTLIGEFDLPSAINKEDWYNIKIETLGPIVKTYINNVLVNELNDNSHTSGRIGIRNSGLEHSHIDNLVISVSGNQEYNETFDEGLGQWGSGFSGHVKAQLEPIRINEIITPVAMTTPGPGIYIFDMGKNISGWAEITVEAPAGTAIALKFAERLYRTGTLNNTSNLQGMPAEAIDTFICKGNGIEVWEPRFTYHGFRYVEVRGFPGTPTINSIKGKFIHSDITSRQSSFDCSNPLVTKICNAYKITQLDNMMGYPTDCNQRAERAGWLADAMVTSESAMLYFDAFRFYEKWINDILIDEKGNGASGVLIPGGGGDDVIWGSACVSIPWDFYLMSGDISILLKTYERCKRYVNWYKSLDKNNNYILDNSTEGPLIQWNDWNTCGAKPSNDFMGSAYFFHCSNIVAKMAKVLNRTSDDSVFSTLAANIRTAINSKYLLGGNRYDNNSQAANSIAINFGIVPDANKEDVVLYLRNTIAKTSHVSTGALGTYSLMPALADNGSNDMAYTLAAQTSFPSWGYMLTVPDAPGTFWEHWDNQNLSKNHPYLAGSVANWLINHAAGIKPISAGFDTIQLKPGTETLLDSASAKVATVKGYISSNWKKTKTNLIWELTIPANITAIVRIPYGKLGKSIHEGDILIWQDSVKNNAKGLKFIKEEGNYTSWIAGSGTYTFLVQTDSLNTSLRQHEIHENLKEDGIQVFPNPASNKLQITCKNLKLDDIQITDENGKLVFHCSEAFYDSKIIDLSEFRSGIYIIKMRKSNTSVVRKFVKA